MAVGQHEAISIRPGRIVRIETQEALPKRINDGRQCHWRAGMAGIGLLHGIHRECANGVYAKLIERAVLFGSPAQGFCGSDRCQSGFGWHWEASRDLRMDTHESAFHPVHGEGAMMLNPEQS